MPKLEIHTKKKHEIYSHYLHDWILTTCGNHRGNSSTVTIVDGFCGGSFYRQPDSSDIWYGSPVRILKAIKEGLNSVAERKGKTGYQLDYKVILMDNQQEHLDSTRNALEANGFGNEVRDGRCEFMKGDFTSLLPQCLDAVRKRKGYSVFLIDPFGYTDFSMADLRSIMQLGRTEIFLTFMIEFVQRFMSLREAKLRDAFERVLEANGFFTEYAVGRSDSEGQQIYLKHESQRLIRERVGPNYLYVFSLMAERNKTKYYLFHLANSPRATQVVKDTLWAHNNINLQYGFAGGQFGLGHITPDYLEELEQQKLFVIEDINAEAAKDALFPTLIDQIDRNRNGITFQQVEINTMQENPARSSMYQDVIRSIRDEGDVAIYRDGKSTRAMHLRSGDVIRRIPKQLFLFGPKPP
ncbi:hypothetical protein Lepil_3636 [Leptonema illini DSM 21528]|uniref:Three-Cys-motif partner protein TcmP n=2 Tax=Leptonema illini TaxID=183 RepID=H2CKI8_9LEPT|nr:three-Cys-motif partner protein TcmP [Leptonema illini]EHQ08293.1 hypothetical protein Lepil_3636 [Leptonema illini DSM 21528]